MLKEVSVRYAIFFLTGKKKADEEQCVQKMGAAETNNKFCLYIHMKFWKHIYTED